MKAIVFLILVIILAVLVATAVATEGNDETIFLPLVNRGGYCFVCSVEDYEAGRCYEWCTPENWCGPNRTYCRNKPWE